MKIHSDLLGDIEQVHLKLYEVSVSHFEMKIIVKTTRKTLVCPRSFSFTSLLKVKCAMTAQC